MSLSLRVSILAICTASFGVSALAQELNLYSSRHYDTDERLYSDFTKATGIKINRIEAKHRQPRSRGPHPSQSSG